MTFKKVNTSTKFSVVSVYIVKIKSEKQTYIRKQTNFDNLLSKLWLMHANFSMNFKEY